MDRLFQTRILRMPEIETRSGLSRPTINRKWQTDGEYFDPTFPPKVQLGLRAIGMEEAALERWLAAQALEAGR